MGLSETYKPKRQGATNTKWCEGDEYRSDDDPGYRIRDLLVSEACGEFANLLGRKELIAQRKAEEDRLRAQFLKPYPTIETRNSAEGNNFRTQNNNL